jgi:hypothetical protein
MALSNYQCGARVDKRRLVLDDERGFREAMWRMKEGLVVVKIEQPQRTNALNRFYWKFVIKPTSEAYGYTPDEMHEAWKWKFLRLEDPDRPMPTVRSTTDLTNKEMFEYIELIRIQAAGDFSLQIPEYCEHLEATA